MRQFLGRRYTDVEAAVFIAAVALVVRAIYWLQIRGADAYGVLMVDERSYHEWALRILQGNGSAEGVFYQAPLYPYLLAGIYGLFGAEPARMRLLQFFLGALSSGILAAAGARFFGLRAGLAAGLLLALWPSTIFLEGQIQKDALGVNLLTLLLLLLSREVHSPGSGRRWAAMGVTLGLLGLTRENALVLVLPLLLWLGLGRQGSLRSRVARWRATACFVAGLTASLLPVGLRNLAVGGEMVLTTAQFGPNLYIGNGTGANGTYRPLRPGRGDPWYERQDARALAEEAVGRRLSDREVSRYWVGEVLKRIARDPGGWVWLLAHKARLTFHREELGDAVDQRTFGEWSVLLRALNAVCHFGLLLPLSALGIALTWRQRRRIWVLHAAIISYAASVALFYVFSRYRLPLVPMLALFAGVGLSHGIHLLRRDPQRLLAGLSAAAAVLPLALWPFPGGHAAARANTYFNIGVGLSAAPTRLGTALFYLGEAARVAPTMHQPHLVAGDIQRRLGRPQDAVPAYAEAARLEPRDPAPRLGLGAALMEMGRCEEAVTAFRVALALESRGEGSAEEWLGVALAGCGRPGEALPYLAKAVGMRVGSAAALLNYGSALLDVGRPAEALAVLRRALNLDPTSLRVQERINTAARRIDEGPPRPP